jgi:hypothetical protein
MEKLPKILLSALIVLYLSLAAAYSIVTPAATPIQHNPDENAHLLYVQTLASGHLPVFTDVMHGYENHQPPLYYALCVPVYLAAHGLGAGAVAHAVRGVSILLGALLIFASYRCIRLAFPEQPWAALGTAACVGLLPGNIALSASVTNDALTNLLAAVCLCLLAAWVGKPGVGDKQAIWLGLVLGAGIWTKTSALVLFPTVLLACYLTARNRQTTPAKAGRTAAIACGLSGLIGLPWLLRNQLLYGDPLAQHIFVTAFSSTAQADVIARALYGGSIADYLGGVAQWTFASFWGGFDSMLLFWGQNPHAHLDPNAHGAYAFLTHPLPLIYDLLAVSCVLASVGLCRLAWERRTQAPTSPSVLLPVFAVLIALVGLVFLRFILTFFQAQGRYWYPALLPLAFFYVFGWQSLLPRRASFPAFVCLLSGGLLALNVYTLVALLVPRFS